MLDPASWITALYAVILVAILALFAWERIQNTIVAMLGAGLCLLIAGFFYLRVLRRMRLLTLPDLFRTRFGPTAEIVSSLSIIPAYVGWVGAQFVGFGYILHTLTGREMP